MGKKIGIDLGTTQSCISVVDDTGVLRVIDSYDSGSATTPSVVYFDPDTSEVLVGDIAKSEGFLHPECMVQCIKNYMSDVMTIDINGHEYSPSEISSIILTKLIRDAEKWLGEEKIDGAVITCPAYFADVAHEAMIRAGTNVTLNNGEKLKVLKIIPEPVAAALAFAELRHEKNQKNILIYDLGGATFDVTVMKLNITDDDKKAEIITIDGNHQLGGRDWDSALACYVRERFCELAGCDPDEILNDSDQNQWYSETIERAKMTLSRKEIVTVVPSFNGNREKIEITREIFEAETESLLNQTIQIIDDMLEKRGLSIATDIDEIVLVGGSTKMPQVKKRLMAEYGKPINSFEQDKLVAMGAALVANGLEYTTICEEENKDNPSKKIIEICSEEFDLGHGWSNESVGIEIYHRGGKIAATLVAFGDTTPKFVSTKDLLQMKLGSKYNPHKEIVAVLYKYRSHMELVEISECFECAQVEFSNKWHLKNNSDIWFDLEYNDGWNNESDYLTIHYGHENLTEKKEVKWKKIGTIMG